jgi:uncharacterized protein
MGDVSSEPSMEDILASIKKIIAEDSDKKLSPSLSVRRAPSHDVPVRETEVEAEVVEAPAAVDADEADVFELKAEAIEPAPVVDDAEIVSDTTAAASRTALSSLSRLIVKPEVEGSDTLEGVVREMLRPMLKEWLDANLPQLVEAMVAKEIARISGKTLI